MAPREAVNRYLNDISDELAASTVQNHSYRLDKFLAWADEAGLDDMNDITGAMLQDLKESLMDDVAKVTVKNHLSTVRQFVEFCEDIGVAPAGAARRIRLPTLQVNEDVRDIHLVEAEAEEILNYCETYEYATLRHTIFYLLWHTGLRASALTGLDIDDYDQHSKVIAVRHRPETETPLKNKDRSERDIYIKEPVAAVVDDFLDMHHPYVEDEYGRMPLLGGTQGRLHYTTVQRNVYTLTRPCHYTNECPHDREIPDCEATTYNDASKCPSSVSPHALRKGAATSLRKSDVPKEVASERLDMSEDVLDKHYDRRTEREKMERRKEYLSNL